MHIRTLFGSIACLLVSAVAAQQVTPVPYKATVKPSYVRSWEAAAPEKNGNTLTGRPVKDVKQSTQYFDGLGRPLQTVVKQGSQATGKTAGDLVSPVLYDAYGREVHAYLPFAANATGGNASLNDGQFKYNPFQQDSVFNKGQFPGETFYYSKKNYEASPQNRVLETYAPGNSWVGSEGNTDANTRRNISNLYLVNSVSDSVRIWNGAGSSFTTTAVYTDGLLYKNVIIDEHKKQVIEFKDKAGNTILKKVQLAANPSSGHTGWLCTYYLYDELDNLRLVIQPKGVELLMSNSWNLAALNGSILNEFCFRYEYDEKNRLVEKKVPGAGMVWMVYDARDRLVLTQDSVNRGSSTKKWLYTQYDGLNRPIASGLWNNTSDRAYHKTQANTSTAYPNLSGQTYEELSRTYYDDYNWAASLPATIKDFSTSDINSYLQAASNTTWPYPQAVQKTTSTLGLVTGSKIKVLASNPAQVLASVIFYDDKGRVIQTRSQNVTNGVDVVTTQYAWNGQPLVIIQKQEKAAPNAQSHVIITKFTYDDLGRLLTVKKTVNSTINGSSVSKPEQTIASHEYGALGQLTKKILGTPVIDSLRYEYNIRGWLLGANRAYAKDAHQNNYFGFDLGYDKMSNGLIGNQSYAAAQYNGNIAGTVWKSKGDGEKRKYDFGYDAANRLLKADFTQYTGSAFNTSAGLDFTAKDLSYDANGNITSMTQRGWKLGGSVTIDSLLYTYDNSNKLKNVIDRTNDTQTKLGDFRSSSLYLAAIGTKSITAIDYVYDGNGNMVRDRNKDIGDAANNGIAYNHLNLPSVVTVRTTGGVVKGTITYSYDAAGNKLKKTVVETGKPSRTTLYLDGSVYENDTLQFLAQEEGRLRYAKQYYQNGSSSYKYYYDYFLKDHLGNVRMVLTEQKDTAVYIATMEAAYRTKEDSLFYNIPETSYPSASVPEGYPADGTTSPNDSLARVNGSGQKVGPSIVLRVMSGDKVDLAVKSFYRGSGSAGPTSDPLADILSALAGGIVGAAGESKGAFTQLNNPSTSPLTGVLNSFRTTNNPNQSTKPKAYLNWVLLDEQLKYVSAASGAAVVGNAGELKPLMPASTLTMPKNGFLYIYVSNETQGWDVFFDNLSVRHFTGPMLEETHYYPFGLVQKGISTKASGRLINKDLYSGKELQSSEFSNDAGLDLYDFGARNYDFQIGRWTAVDPLQEDEYFDENDELEGYETQVQRFDFIQSLEEFGINAFRLSSEGSAVNYDQSPYNFVRNNPMLYIDPYGLDTLPAVKTLPAVTVTGRQSTLPWWGDITALFTGSYLVDLGQPVIGSKTMVTQATSRSVAASPGSSKASMYLSKKLDNSKLGKSFKKWPRFLRKAPVGVPKILGGKGARMAITTSAGRFLGRWVPVVGWGLLAWDIIDNRKEIGSFISGVKETNAANAYKSDGSWNTAWHICFAKGTLVYGQNGKQQIEDIEVGDVVYSFNFDKNQLELNEVINVIKSLSQDIYEVTAGNEKILVTSSHPFFVINRGWTRVSDLRKGDALKSNKRNSILVSDIKQVRDEITVYNIEVSGNHNYFITNCEILVHNKNINGIKFKDSKKISSGSDKLKK